MARVRDVPCAVRSVGAAKFFRNLCRRIVVDDLSTQAAAVAYAWLFAVFPFLIFLITLAAYLPEAKKLDAKSKIADTIQKVMEPHAAKVVTENLDQILKEPRGGLLSVGLLVTLWVASGGMRTTMSSLDTAYDAKQRRPFYIQWPLAVALTVIVASMAAVVFVLMPIGSALEYHMTTNGVLTGANLWVFSIARTALAVILVLAFLSLVYQFGTVVRHPFAFISPGALFTLLIWFALGWGFRVYIERFASYDKTYGALGGVAILLLFFYLDAWVLLVGAEINSQVDECCAAINNQPTLFKEGPLPDRIAPTMGE